MGRISFCGHLAEIVACSASVGAISPKQDSFVTFLQHYKIISKGWHTTLIQLRAIFHDIFHGVRQAALQVPIV